MNIARHHLGKIVSLLLFVCLLLVLGRTVPSLGAQEEAQDSSASDDGMELVFDFHYAYGILHVMAGEEDYRFFQGGNDEENYSVTDGSIGEAVSMTNGHLLVLPLPTETIRAGAFDSFGYPLSMRAFDASGTEITLTQEEEGYVTIPSDGTVSRILVGEEFPALMSRPYSTNGDNMTPENNAVLAFAESLGFDVDSFIEHNGWTIVNGRYDLYYETEQGQKDMANSVEFTDNCSMGSIWPDNVWQGINKWIGASTWEGFVDYLHNGANPGTQCAGLVNCFFGYIYKTDLYKDSSWKAYYDAYSYGTRNNLAGLFGSFNSVSSVECGILGLEHFKGTNGYYVQSCNNYTMSHDDFIAMLDQMAPGAVIRFANNIGGVSDGSRDLFAYQHSGIYIGKANGLHWMFHNNSYGKKARISPIEFFANSFIQGNGDTIKTLMYIGHAGGMLNVPQETIFSVSAPGDGTTPAMVTVGENLVISAEATGNITGYTWQVSKDGGSTFTNVNQTKYPSAKTSNLSFTVKDSMDGFVYRCKLSYKDGTEKVSSLLQLTFKEEGKITSQPSNTTVNAGKKATFKVKTEGEVTNYQWQVSTDGGKTWVNLLIPSYPSAETATLSFNASASQNGYQYRCVVLFTEGKTVVSSAVKLTISTNSLTMQPSAITLTQGNSASFTVGASGTVSSYQWQVSKNGGTTWKNINVTSYPSAKTASLSFTTKGGMDGYLYRCRVKFSDGLVLYSNAVALHLNSIRTQPQDTMVKAEGSASFTVAATGNVSKYQWQVSKNGGSTWKNVNQTTYPSAATGTLTFATRLDLNGYLYRCKVTFSDGGVLYSETALLTVNGIQKQPEDTTASAEETVTLTIRAVGEIASYQWQVSKNGGATWKVVNQTLYPSAATDNLTFTAKETMDGYLYRCRVNYNGGTMSLSETITLTVNE